MSSEYGWNQAGESVPHSTGIVRLEVTIFPSIVPLRERIRQHYAFQFNSFTIGQVISNEIQNLETISSSDGSEIGISFKKINNSLHTICGIVAIGSTIAGSEDTFFPGLTPSKNPTYTDRVKGQFYIDETGDRLYYPNEAAKKAHQTFVANGSLFSPSFNTLEEVAIFAQLDDQTSDPAKYKFYSSIISSPATILLPESDDKTKESKSKSTLNSSSKFEASDSNYIPGDPNGPSLGQALNDSNLIEGDSLANSSGKLLTTLPGQVPSAQQAQLVQSFKGYVGVTNVYVGNLITAMRQADIELRTENDGINFSGTFNDANIRSYRSFPPGIHASFIKALPIFPGEDFTIKFRRLSPNNPIAVVEDEISGPVRWKMQKQYRFIDTGSFHLSDNGVITANFGVCPLTFNKEGGSVFWNSRRTVPEQAGNYYLANQPYVAIEIDAGIENRYFLLIPEKGNVIMLEVTSDFEISQVVDEDGNLSKVIVGNRIPHSRVIHNFNITGSSLLKLDSFAVHFQHYRGMLEVTFDPIDVKQVVTRHRFGNDLPALLLNIKRYLFLDDPIIKDKINPEKIPIKLSGAVQVHMGHVKMAFNFSPITYPENATLNISYPVGITNLKGNKEAVNILLRASGSFSENEKSRSSSRSSGLIKNEFGTIPGQSSPYYMQFASSINEIINGKSYSANQSDFSEMQKMSITGPSSSSDPAWSSSYGTYGKQSNISASFRLTDTKEFVNRVHPYIVLSSGDMTLKGSSGSWTLKGATRPICQGFSVFVPEGAKSAWNGISADVTNNVLEFSDNWDRSDRTFLSHTGTLKFYLNKSDALPILENITAVQTEKGSLLKGVRKATSSNSNNVAQMGEYAGDQTAFLASLQDKYFYFEVRAWRDPLKTKSNNVGATGSLFNNPSTNSNSFFATYKNKVPDSENTLMFVGLCRKSSYNIMDSHIEMTCKLEDYWSILDSLSWLNPPFYDAMRDYDAVMDVMQRAGFFYERSNRDPAFLINKFVTTPSDSDYHEIAYDGSKVLANDYVLPGSYNTLNQPLFRPTSGTGKYSETLKRFAEISGKVIYFDRRGIMHFDIPPDELEIMQITGSSSNKILYTAPILDIFSHTYTSPNGNVVPWWNIVIEGYTFERAVNDIVNEIRVVSSTPEGTLVSAAHMNRASLSDIDLPGFIGFRKMFMQKSGYFGSGEAVRKQVERYTTMFNAPVVANFTVLGRVGLQAGETILIDGPGHSGAYRLLLTNVSNTILPKENSWKANVSGRYFIPGEKIKFNGTTINIGGGG